MSPRAPRTVHRRMTPDRCGTTGTTIERRLHDGASLRRAARRTPQAIDGTDSAGEEVAPERDGPGEHRWWCLLGRAAVCEDRSRDYGCNREERAGGGKGELRTLAPWKRCARDLDRGRRQGLGQCPSPAVVSKSGKVGAVGLHVRSGLAETEIGEKRTAVAIDEHVPRLDSAVDVPRTMSGVKYRSHVLEQPGRHAGLRPPASSISATVDPRRAGARGSHRTRTSPRHTCGRHVRARASGASAISHPAGSPCRTA